MIGENKNVTSDISLEKTENKEEKIDKNQEQYVKIQCTLK